MNGIRILLVALAVGFSGTTGALGQTSLLDAAKGILGSVQEAAPGSGVGSLTTGEIAGGLREALRVGTERVVGQVGAVDGFNSDPEIHIPLPSTLAKVQSALRMAGMERACQMKLRNMMASGLGGAVCLCLAIAATTAQQTEERTAYTIHRVTGDDLSANVDWATSKPQTSAPPQPVQAVPFDGRVYFERRAGDGVRDSERHQSVEQQLGLQRREQ